MTEMEFERRTFDAQPYVYVEGESTYEPQAMADAMSTAFGKIFGLVGAAGIEPLSTPINVYLGMDPDLLRFRAGFLVSDADAARASGEMLADTLPAGDAMAGLHVGPYENMHVSHKAMWDHMAAEGIEGAMPVWEIYVDEPGTVPPEEMRTEIYRAIA